MSIGVYQIKQKKMNLTVTPSYEEFTLYSDDTGKDYVVDDTDAYLTGRRVICIIGILANLCAVMLALAFAIKQKFKVLAINW